MSLDPQNDPTAADGTNNLLTKILKRLTTVSGGGGGGGTVDQGTGGTSAWKVDGSGVTQPVSGPLTDTQLRASAVPVSVADGSDVATGAKANAAASDSTSSWSVISMLKGIFALLNGTGNITVKQATGTNLKVDLSGTAANATAVKTDGSAVTQPVSIAAAVTVQQSTGTNLKVDLSGTAANATAVKVDNSAVTQPASIADGSDAATGAKANTAATDSTSSWSVISMLKGIYALLNGTGSITVKQSTAANLKVDGSGVTQPVSGTVTVQQSTASNLKVDLSGTAANATAVKVDGSAVTQPVSFSGGVGGKMNVIKDTTAVTASNYSAGNAVGGKRTYANALTSAGTGVLESITLLDRNNQSQPMTVIIFDADPTNATITDKSAFVYSTDDLKVLGQITISASDYITTNSKAIATIRGIGLSLKSAGTSLYVALVTTGTPTFAATTDVQLILGILQD